MALPSPPPESAAPQPAAAEPRHPEPPARKPPAAISPCVFPTAGLPATAPGLPGDADGPVFPEPWQAQAFAIVLTLQARGLFTWDEWATALAEQIRAAEQAGTPGTENTYYGCWLTALETIVARKGLVDPAALARCGDAWGRAAERTPHGRPIELTPEDFAGP
jgi:nitrile hydratase accessory protein